ncbi:MAG: hypothetical protein U9Q40_02455 [Campylobacterota bacterium]|nr:hypothetical protein [Campylobacterota bacterium]
MTSITINNNIIDSYKQTIREVLLTPKNGKFTAKTKRYFAFLKANLHITRYSQVLSLLLKNPQDLVSTYSVIHTDEKNYAIYDDLRKVWAKRLVNLTDIKVCPYCNRNFVINYAKTGTTVELDHFYPKKDYPYLCINLYNLIPSCHTCNHKKGTKQLDIYPYTDSINNYVKFSFGINKLPFLANNINLFFTQKKNSEEANQKIYNYMQVLNIPTLYENHKDIVSELLEKREIYADSYIDDLMRQYEGTLFKNREDLLRLITCGYVSDEDINKRPLSKLIKDISEELKLI